MRKISKYFYCTALSVSLSMSVISSVPVFADMGVSEVENTIKSGTCSSDGKVLYEIKDEGTLHIYGEGSIQENAFEGNSEIKNVIIDEGITTIEANAFTYCENLISIQIPSTVTEIKAPAILTDGFWYGKIGNPFWGCKNLAQINVSDANTVYNSDNNTIIKTSEGIVITATDVTELSDNVKIIGSAAFSDCTQIEKIIIPDSVTEIEDNAFYNCSGLKEITISENVQKIGQQAFRDCKNLETVTIPKKVTKLSSGIFKGCSKLGSVKLPDDLETIDSEAFADCDNLIKISLPLSVKSFENNSFSKGCLLCFANASDAEKTDLKNYNYKIEKITTDSPKYSISTYYGDFDENKDVDLSDVVTALKIALGIEKSPYKDTIWTLPLLVNDKGEVIKEEHSLDSFKLSDVTYLLNVALGLDKTYEIRRQYSLNSDYDAVKRVYDAGKVISFEPNSTYLDIISDDVYEKSTQFNQNTVKINELKDTSLLNTDEKLEIAEVYDVSPENLDKYYYYKMSMILYSVYDLDCLRITADRNSINIKQGWKIKEGQSVPAIVKSETMYFKIAKDGMYKEPVINYEN